MLLSSGWDRNSGLGPAGTGKLYPVKTALKRDRSGLGLEAETGTCCVTQVTHFAAHDASSVADVADVAERTEKVSTAGKRRQKRQLAKETAKEVNFRREFSSL
jgi:hypothetical protein